MPIMECQTCKKKHASVFYQCENCGYVSCHQEDGGRSKRCPDCNKANKRKKLK